jgi:phage shock protein PspC (stress-responsive transcriptional regulator)
MMNTKEVFQMAKKKLTRSRDNQMISGVCAGIAEYFEVDPTLIRLAWVAFGLMGGGGLIAYIIAAIIIPLEGEE